MHINKVKKLNELLKDNGLIDVWRMKDPDTTTTTRMMYT